ncbi:MAG: hypothetical protein GXP55_25045 [Deltaproteobacteria bacterium]|nr:hypothetical protein [Deltaproteobacteria bacterium]
MNKHRLTLLGGVQGELRVSASILHETVGALLEGARQATRFFVEGESIRKGPRPAWLEATCEIQITALSPGSAVLALEAPTLEEADPARFGEGGQTSLFDEHDRKIAKQTSIDLFGSVLAAIVEGDPDDVLADRALLDTCFRFATAARGPFDGVQLDGLANRSAPVVIKPEHVPKIERLRDETPPAQAVRVSGTLDTISASRPDVVLTLPDGVKVPARLEDHEAEMLKQLFGEKVVVSGMAHYRPSGRLLLVNVESIAAAGEKDVLFEATPVVRARRPVAQMLPQDETSGVSAFFGTWPGDESDEALLEALRAIG